MEDEEEEVGEMDLEKRYAKGVLLDQFREVVRMVVSLER